MNNKHSPFAIHNLNPGLVTEVNRAYQRNVEAGRVVDDQFTDGVAVESLADVLHRGTETEKSVMNGTLSWEIEDEETRKDFETAFRDATSLFDRIGAWVPSPEDFGIIGVKFGELAKKYEIMQRAGQEPQVVIAPHRDSCEMWFHLYQDLMTDANLKWSTKREADETSLLIGNGVIQDWKGAIDAYRAIAKPPIFRVWDESRETGYNDWIDWSVRLIPTASNNTLNYSYDSDGGIHPTVAEYLTLQAVRIQSNKQPIDKIGSAWLHGTLGRNSATIGFYNYGQKKVYVDTINKIYLNDARTIRQPQW